MKRLLIITLALCISAAGFAQTKTATTQTKPVVKKEVVKMKQTSAPDKISNKTATANTATATSTNTKTKLKKDGTPDKRFKENKTATTATTNTPTKKNGTPDMRYKANKKKG